MTDEQQVAQLDLLRRLNRHQPESPTKPTWPRGSKASSWPTACRWPRPRRSTSTASRPTFASCTASTTPSASTSPGSAHGPAAGRAGRAVRADLLRRHGERTQLGRPPEHPGQPQPVRRRDRHADRRPADRSEAARPARIDAGHLVRRVRPAADRAKGGHRPRPQPARLHHLAGRRRREGGRPLRRTPTRSATKRSSTA